MDKLKTKLVIVVIRVLSWLPLKGMQRVGVLIGYCNWFFKSEIYRATSINIGLCYPNLPEDARKILIKRSLIETGKAIAESGAAWGWKPSKCLKTVVRINGEQYLEKALADKKGMLLLVPHLGNWEILGVYCSSRFPITTMFKESRLKGIGELIKNAREDSGNTLVPTSKKGLVEIIKTLKAGGNTSILPDQEPEDMNSGEFAPFFGINALTMTFVSKLSQKTGANIICGYAERLPDGKGYEIHFKPADGVANKDINKSLAAMNSVVEKCIQEIPEQYQWEYKRFKRWYNNNNYNKRIRIYHARTEKYITIKDIKTSGTKTERFLTIKGTKTNDAKT